MEKAAQKLSPSHPMPSPWQSHKDRLSSTFLLCSWSLRTGGQCRNGQSCFLCFERHDWSASSIDTYVYVYLCIYIYIYSFKRHIKKYISILYFYIYIFLSILYIIYIYIFKMHFKLKLTYDVFGDLKLECYVHLMTWLRGPSRKCRHGTSAVVMSMRKTLVMIG